MDYLKYVEVRQGTASNQRFSRGNTQPLTQLPFGSHGFIPQTNALRQNWYYRPDDRSLEGIRLVHQPSPWVGDYACLLMMPQAGQPEFESAARWSGYRTDEAVMRPDYLRLRFLRSGCTAELVPTMRGAILRLAYPAGEAPLLAVFPGNQYSDTCHGVFECRQLDKYTLTGCTTAHSVPTAENFKMHFVLRFDCPITCAGRHEASGSHAAALSSSTATVRLAASYISPEQALLNLEQELAGRDLDALRKQAAEAWNDLLSTVEIETADAERMRTFYSCMYRMFLYPHSFHEVDAAGATVHRCPDTGKMMTGPRYVDNGLWDTFRTVYPFFSLVAPDRYADILEGFVNTYRACGWLPKWPAPAEFGIMPGTLIDAVVADAAVKGIAKGRLLEDACAGMEKHIGCDAPEHRYGRRGTAEYKRLGYIPCDGFGESVNHTLDYVYGDFCLAQVLFTLGRNAEAEQALARAKNYRLLFDAETGFMRPKYSDGAFLTPFDPLSWGEHYCEGSAWQNSFAVYHDIEGLAALYGGPEKLTAKMDALLAAPPVYHTTGYGREIHEMTEMANVDFGQCAISNQPSFHLPYIYAAFGMPQKTEALVERLLTLFSAGPGGFPGDEDNGSTSGWYIFSVLGLFPFCPGKPEYLRVKPHVERAVIHTPTGDYTVSPGQPAGAVSHFEITGEKA